MQIFLFVRNTHSSDYVFAVIMKQFIQCADRIGIFHYYADNGNSRFRKLTSLRTNSHSDLSYRHRVFYHKNAAVSIAVRTIMFIRLSALQNKCLTGAYIEIQFTVGYLYAAERDIAFGRNLVQIGRIEMRIGDIPLPVSSAF